MKNLVVVLLFVGVVGGVGFWLMSEGSDNVDPAANAAESTEDVEPDTDEEDKPENLPVVSETGPWPKPVVSEREFDFGSMVVGSKMSHTFTIRNEGEADLELLEGEATCKCTEFKLSSRLLKPGEEAELKIEWHGKFKDAKFRHGGPIYTNAPEKEELNFAVFGIVDDVAELYPATIWNVPVAAGAEDAAIEGFIASRVFDDFEISSVKCDSPYVKISTRQVTSEYIRDLGASANIRRAYAVTVQVTEDMPPGLLEEQLEIKLDIMDNPFIATVRAKKIGPIRILPAPGVLWTEDSNGLRLGNFSSAKGREAVLNLLTDTKGMTEPLKFVSVKAEPAYVKVDLEPSGAAANGPSGRYKMTVRIPPGIPRTKRDRENPGKITIETNHPSGQQLHIKLSFTSF